LGFADYRGNKQYISLGNVGGDDRVALIFVDYPNRARLKVLARASIVTADSAPEVFAVLAEAAAADGARIERAFVLRVEGFDWNCPQHITPRFTEDEVRESVAPLLAKLEAAEAENRELRATLARLRATRC
jgi:predicted pyridoxine 5'-phosphate oxidase superfamily flavin-nucleotide-binding protein